MTGTNLHFPKPFEKPHKAQKVICLGWQKTGTSTLIRALRTMGYKSNKCVTYQTHLAYGRVNLNHVLEFVALNDSVSDFPFPLLYREIDEHFSGCRFILTTRDPCEWQESFEKHAHRLTNGKIDETIYGFNPKSVADNTHLAQQACDRFMAHNQEIIRYFEGRQGDLLVWDLTANAEWGPLCDFLNEPQPEEPFPWTNKAPSAPFSSTLKTLLNKVKGR